MLAIFSHLVQGRHTLAGTIQYTSTVEQCWHVGKIMFKKEFINWMRGVLENNHFPVPHNVENPYIKLPLLKQKNDLIQENKGNKKFNLILDLKGVNPSKVDPLGIVDLNGIETPSTKMHIQENWQKKMSNLMTSLKRKLKFSKEKKMINSYYWKRKLKV